MNAGDTYIAQRPLLILAANDRSATKLGRGSLFTNEVEFIYGIRGAYPNLS
jgi:hypothetical protein